MACEWTSRPVHTPLPASSTQFRIIMPRDAAIGGLMPASKSHAATLLERIETQKAVCGVVGLGYEGLPLAVELANAGFHVLGFDVSENVCAGINRGHSHIQDISSERLSEFTKKGFIEAT